MKKNTFRKSVWFLIFPLLVSCNIYRPFTKNSTPEDFLEEALKCLHNGDFACAISNYNQLPAGELKSQKLCTAFLSKAGFTLNALLNIVGQSSNNQMMGNLANSMIPWNSTKQGDAALAKTNCEAFATSTASSTDKPTRDLGTLFKTMSHFVECALFMAKTDQFVANSTADTTCTTPGNNSGTVTAGDISDNADGSITSVGMCSADANACNDDISTLNTTELSNAGLGDIKGAFDQFGSTITTANQGAQVSRGALRTLVPAN